MKEYTLPPSSYAHLKHYNTKSLKGPSYQGVANSVPGYYMVPDINPILSYDTLVKGHSSSGYASITTAYGTESDNCCPGYKQMPVCAPVPCTECSQVLQAECTPNQVKMNNSCTDTSAGPSYV